MVLKDTTVGTSTVVDTLLAQTTTSGGLAANNAKTLRLLNSATESATSIVGNATLGAQLSMALDTTVGNVGYVSARFNVFLETAAAGVDAGVYNYTVVVKSYDNGVLNATKTVSTTATITVGALAANSRTVDPGQSSAVLGVTTANFGSSISDSVVSVVATGTGSTVATLRVRLRNATGGNAQESITATISAGTIGNGTIQGRSVILPATAGDNDLVIRGDGTGGVANITVKSGVWSMTSKSLTFFSATAAKIVATRGVNVIGASTSIALLGNQSDAAGNDFGEGTTVFAYSADTSVISNNGTACTYNSTFKAALCTLTGVKNGKAKVTLRDASTVALSTVASEAVEFTVNLNAAASVEIALNKATYSPGEKATVKITVKDAAGAILPPASYSALFATGGITTSASIGNAASSTLLANTAVVTQATLAASADTPLVSLDAVGQTTFFMPMAGGTVTLSATGGTSLPLSGQKVTTTTATVTDSGAAALAAVTALATTVASLKTLITTLTNLVLKIQKKVKA